MNNGITLIVQAGGNSSRMGGDKALKSFLGQPMIERVIERLAPLADEIMVTTNRPEDYHFLDLRLVPDLVPNCGALGGLYSGLSAASLPVTAVIACDMPFANLALFQVMTRLLLDEGHDAVIPHTAQGWETMHAVYRRDTCLPVVRQALEARRLKMIDWLSKVRVRRFSGQEILSLDPNGLCFFNVNINKEFDRAEEMARSMSG